ncbi:uncharacterized protein [Procambarus clarkii]|uniref:uncharacterized protein n=1 Tax=Procambarus clarkii TaxID=6728 RepID=UPI0037427210
MEINKKLHIAQNHRRKGTVQDVSCNVKRTGKAERREAEDTEEADAGLRDGPAAGRTGEDDEGRRDGNPTPDTAGDTVETLGDGRSGKTAAEEPGDETVGAEPPERAVFLNTITRSLHSPAGGTTPHAEPESSDAGDAPEASSTGTSLEETSIQAAAGTWTSATTEECDGTLPLSLEDPPSSNSPASTQSEDLRDRLGTGLTSSEPDVDPETRTTQAGRTDALRRTAASSTTRETRSSTGGGPTATPAPSTSWAHGEGAVTGTTDGEQEDGGAVHTGAGRTTEASRTATGAGRTPDGDTTA